MEPDELRGGLEAILFVSNEPVSVDDLAEAFNESTKEEITSHLEEIKRLLDEANGGFILERTAGGWRYATRPEHDGVLKKYFAKKGETRMSIAALETLAIVAYRQPVTAPEVSEIRGVNSTQTIRTLLERRMIRVAGRKNVVGSPFLYRTTREFLVHFGLNDIRDLPRLEEFGDLIGETISEDVVAAITADAESAADNAGAAAEETEAQSGADDALADEGDAANANVEREAADADNASDEADAGEVELESDQRQQD